MAMTGENFDPALTVNQIIRLHPATVQVFNRFGIDACCGGAVPPATAAERDGVNSDELMGALAAVVAGGGA